MPLRHTDVKADITGYISSVQVVQQFQNPFSHKIEATYVFPLPENAAVNDFLMTIGDRQIRGIIRERAEAEEIYITAKRQGHTVSLLTEERPNIFTQAVASLEPGHAIDVTIRYFHTLAYDDGWYEFVFPMVVGPRFNPPHLGQKDGIGAVLRGESNEKGQRTSVPYLGPGERSGHDISLSVSLDAGVALEETQCSSHRTTLQRVNASRATLVLNDDDSIPNRDFVLRYRVAGDGIKSGLLMQEDARGGFFSLMLYPPAKIREATVQPLELIFVLDCSGSMYGAPLSQAKAAIRRALDRLEPGDSFQIINFSERSSALGERPLEVTRENVERGRRYLNALNSDGPTMMIEGIKAALNFPHDPERLRFVCFVTDGFIGNESEIFAEVQKRLGASRIFSFGIGSAPNRHLLDGLARVGRGVAAYVASHDDATRVMDAFCERIRHPALTDVNIDWGELKVSDVFPARAPDLFVGRPIILTGRFGGRPQSIRVSGQAGGEKFSIPVAAVTAGRPAKDGTTSGAQPSDGRPSALPSVWARMKIAELADRSLNADKAESADLAASIKKVALDFNLMSAYTAFVAVDASRKTDGAPAITAPVAVPLPVGVNGQTTLGQGEKGN